MFGEYYHRYDHSLAASAEWTCGTRVEYAEELLKDILNRAAVLESGTFRQASESGPEHPSHLEALRDAVEVFLADCSEARIRARRARLVSKIDNTDLVDTASNSVEAVEKLKQIGGELMTTEDQ